MKLTYKRMVLSSLLLMVAMLLSACGGGDSGSDGPIKIGAIFDITGPTSDVGKPYSEGIKAFVQWKNDNGGIEGRQLELIHDGYGYQGEQHVGDEHERNVICHRELERATNRRYHLRYEPLPERLRAHVQKQVARHG